MLKNEGKVFAISFKFSAMLAMPTLLEKRKRRIIIKIF